MKHQELLFFPYIEENIDLSNFNDNLSILNNYILAINSCDLNIVNPMLSQDASFTIKGKIFSNKIDVENKFIKLWEKYKDGIYKFEDLKVLFESKNTKILNYNFLYQKKIPLNKSVIMIGQVTNIFMLENNEWKLINEYSSDL